MVLNLNEKFYYERGVTHNNNTKSIIIISGHIIMIKESGSQNLYFCTLADPS